MSSVAVVVACCIGVCQCLLLVPELFVVIADALAVAAAAVSAAADVVVVVVGFCGVGGGSAVAGAGGLVVIVLFLIVVAIFLFVGLSASVSLFVCLSFCDQKIPKAAPSTWATSQKTTNAGLLQPWRFAVRSSFAATKSLNQL